MNHKRKNTKNQRAGCLMCKPNKFKLEELISAVWGTKEEIETLFRHVMECKELDRDYLSNALLGIATMHDIKSQELFWHYEAMLREESS